MTMLIADGADDGLTLATLTGGSVAASIQTAAARTGTRGIRAQTSGNVQTSFFSYSIANTTSGVAHFAFQTNTLWSGVSIFQLLDTTTLHAEVRTRADGKFELYTVGTLRATGSFVYTINTWVHLQVKWTIADAGGLIELRVNGSGSADATFTGDTRNGANAYANVVRFGQMTTGVNTTGSPFYFDDIVICDTSGSYNNNYLGDVECRYAFASGAGSQQDWTIAGSSPAATAHASINEVPADDGVTLLESNTVNHRFLLAFDDLSNTSATVYAVATNIRAQKASATARQIKSTAKRTTTTLGSAAHTLSTSWLTFQNIRELDTEGATWTGTNFNSTEFGCDVVT